MSSGARRAAPAAVLVALALVAPPAHAADRADALVGAIAQVQDPDLPPLTLDPPVPLGTPTPTPTATPGPTATATPTRELARTGSQAGLAALAGLSLLGAGLSLRRLTPDGVPG